MRNSDFVIILLIGVAYCGLTLTDTSLASFVDGSCISNGQCSLQGSLHNTSLINLNNGSGIMDRCQAFYISYVYYAGEFTNCELKYARPFRICSECVVQYELSSSIYNDFTSNDELEDCRVKYMRDDRVQIIPSMQAYIENIWSDAACAGCTENIYINITTGNVTFSTPATILHFLDLYRNLSLCLNTSLESFATQFLMHDSVGYSTGNKTVCKDCLLKYDELNNLYTDIYHSEDENVCMDIVDRMNHTRLVWSQVFGCSSRSSKSGPVIAIAVTIGVLPIIFYGVLRYIGKEKKQKVFKQKRLSRSVVRDSLLRIPNANFGNSNTSSTSSSLD